MMFKTVKFNIFQENLQDIIFGKDSSFHPKNRAAEKNAEESARKSTEIIIKPIKSESKIKGQ